MSVKDALRVPLRGRAGECAILDELVEAAREGESRVVVLGGEAGIGKTVLLDYAAASGHGARVLAADGIEAELELPFAALQQLCAPLLGALDRLPPPQRDAVRAVFGLSSTSRPDRF